MSLPPDLHRLNLDQIKALPGYAGLIRSLINFIASNGLGELPDRDRCLNQSECLALLGYPEGNSLWRLLASGMSWATLYDEAVANWKGAAILAAPPTEEPKRPPTPQRAPGWCPCGAIHPDLPPRSLKPEEQRQAWKIYWHEMASIHPPGKFEEGSAYYANWWQIESKERGDPPEREFIYRSWMDDVLIEQIESRLCAACKGETRRFLHHHDRDHNDQTGV